MFDFVECPIDLVYVFAFGYVGVFSELLELILDDGFFAWSAVDAPFGVAECVDGSFVFMVEDEVVAWVRSEGVVDELLDGVCVVRVEVVACEVCCFEDLLGCAS